MTNKFNYNFMNRTIEGSKRSIERANKGLSPEYYELTQKLAEHPDFIVVEKIIKRNESKKTYRNLDLNRMKEYIKLQDDSEQKLVEFEAVKKIAKARGALYPICKKWFLATYPDYKETTVNLNQDAETNESSNEETNEIESMVDSLMEEINEEEAA